MFSLTSQGSKGASRRDVKPLRGLPPLLEALSGYLMSIALALVLSITCIAAFVYWNSRPRVCRPEEISKVLQLLLDGDLDDMAWDYFVSVKVRDPELEAIRCEAVSMWTEGSRFMQPGEINPCCLNDLGRQKVRELLQQCKGLESNVAAT